MSNDVTKRAIAAAGGPTKLAKLIGIQMPSIYSWKEIPAKRVVAVEKASGIPRHELRPDIFLVDHDQNEPSA